MNYHLLKLSISAHLKVFCIAVLLADPFLAGCDHYNNQLSVRNTSTGLVSVSYSNDSVFHTENNVAFYLSSSSIIRPNSCLTLVIPGDANAWHEQINDGKAKKLYFYFWDIDTLRKYNDGIYTMESLYHARKYIKATNYTEKQLMNRKWKVVFP